MEDSRRRLDNNLGATQQDPQEEIRFFAGADAGSAAQAGIEITEAVKGLTPNRHVGVAYQGRAHGEKVLFGISIHGQLRFRELSAGEDNRRLG